jgi:hypothetical protein
MRPMLVEDRPRVNPEDVTCAWDGAVLNKVKHS